MIPVTILTGFLGSGKTTMLAHMLRQPAFSRTAVLINEFGFLNIISAAPFAPITAISALGHA